MNPEEDTQSRASSWLLVLCWLATIAIVSWIAAGCAVTAMPSAPESTPSTTSIAPATPAQDVATPVSGRGLFSTDAPIVALPTPTPVTQALSLPTPTPIPTPPLAPTPDGMQRTLRVPILMYHYVSTPPPGADIYRSDLSVPPATLAAHLDRLVAEGYATISLYDLTANLTQGVPLPDKPVIITFDDGYRDNFTNAFPLFQERGLTATFFVVTDFIDEQRADYLTWDMARAMLAGGMSIESHGRNHVSLEGKDTDYLVWQALGSLETIEHELGVRPRFVSYPAGEYDQNTIDVFRSANYWAGVTTEQGATHSSTNPFELRRVRVRNTTTPDKLIELLQVEW